MYLIEKHYHFDFMNEEYRALFDQADASAFQNPLWLSLVYSQLLGETKPLVITMREKTTGKLIFVAPLIVRQKYGINIVEIADLQVSDYCDFVIDPQHAEAISSYEEAFWDCLKGYDVFWADKTIENDNNFTVFKGCSRFSKSFSRHILPLTSDFNAVREEKYNDSFRRSLDKKTGKLTRKGNFALTELKDAASITTAYDKLVAFRDARFSGTRANNLTNIPTYHNFYLQYALQGLGTYARTYQLTCENDIIAVFLGLWDKGVISGVLVCYDMKEWANWSPGVVVFDQLIKQMVSEGAKAVDFTIGDEPYKYNFGVTSTPIVAMVKPLNVKGRIYFAAYRLVSYAKRTLKKLLKR